MFNECEKYFTNAGQSIRSARLWLGQKSLRRLLACEELRVVEQEVARRLSLPLLPCCPICGESVDNWLRFAGISHDEAKQWLSSERDQLVVFCVATAREFEDDDRDGEFPEGEELDAADKSQLVAVEGYCNGGALMALCEYLVLKQESATALDVFLEKTRTPHRKQFAKRFKVVFDAVPKSQPDAAGNSRPASQ